MWGLNHILSSILNGSYSFVDGLRVLFHFLFGSLQVLKEAFQSIISLERPNGNIVGRSVEKSSQGINQYRCLRSESRMFPVRSRCGLWTKTHSSQKKSWVQQLSWDKKGRKNSILLSLSGNAFANGISPFILRQVKDRTWKLGAKQSTPRQKFRPLPK